MVLRHDAFTLSRWFYIRAISIIRFLAVGFCACLIVDIFVCLTQFQAEADFEVLDNVRVHGVFVGVLLFAFQVGFPRVANILVVLVTSLEDRSQFAGTRVSIVDLFIPVDVALVTVVSDVTGDVGCDVDITRTCVIAGYATRGGHMVVTYAHQALVQCG